MYSNLAESDAHGLGAGRHKDGAAYLHAYAAYLDQEVRAAAAEVRA